MATGVGSFGIRSINYRSKFRDGRLGVLVGHDFRRFYVGYSTSLLGTAMSSLATLGFPLPPLALALHLPAIAVAAGALLAGLGSALGSALEATVTQQRVPAQALSRVSAFNMVGAFASLVTEHRLTR